LTRQQNQNDRSNNGLNSLADNIDLAVFLSAPFVATDCDASIPKQTTLRFTKLDGSVISVTISLSENSNTNYTKIQIKDRLFYKEGKEEDNERLHGFIGSFTAFYKSIEFHTQEETDASQSYWTYHLLESVNK